MSAKKIFATLLIVFGVAAFVAGISRYNNCRIPNTCVVGFAKSLGGKASLDLDRSMRRARYFGIAESAGGALFVICGGVLLFIARK